MSWLLTATKKRVTNAEKRVPYLKKRVTSAEKRVLYLKKRVTNNAS